jgi:O-antigen ligase
LIFAYYLAVDHTAKQWWRRIYWGYIGLAAVSTLLTASRMGVLCLGLCLLGLCLWLLRRNATAALLLLVFMGASLGAAVLWVLPKEGVARLRTTRESFAGETGEADQLGGRLAIWKAGLILAKQSPIIGYGAGTFQVVITREYYHPRVVTAHNSYLSIQVGLGIVGLIFFVGVQLFAVKYAWGLPKTERFIWMILLGTLYLASTALGLEHSKTVWLVMGLVTSHADTMLAWRNDCVR